MKKLIFITLVISSFSGVSAKEAEDSNVSVRALPAGLFTPRTTSQTFLKSMLTSRPAYLGKAAAGAIGALYCGGLCLKGGARKGLRTLADPNESFIFRTGAVGLMVFSFFGLAECSGFTLINMQKALS